MSDYNYGDDLEFFFGGSVRYARNKPVPKPEPTSQRQALPERPPERQPERQPERNQTQRPTRPNGDRRQIDISNDPFGGDHD